MCHAKIHFYLLSWKARSLGKEALQGFTTEEPGREYRLAAQPQAQKRVSRETAADQESSRSWAVSFMPVTEGFDAVPMRSPDHSFVEWP